MRFRGWAFVLGLVLALLRPSSVLAFESYGATVPGFGTLSCQTCHAVAGGGGTCTQLGSCLNPFGNAFRANGYVWNAALGALDSDQDGLTNSAELTALTPTLPGFPNPATSSGCSMETCANTGSHTCNSSLPLRCGASYDAGTGVFSFSFSCVHAGYSYSGPTAYSCSNINECSGTTCGAGGTGGENGFGCNQTPLTPFGSWSTPGYTCACRAGYAQGGSPRRCLITNDCVAGTADCVAAASCADLAGENTFTCTCPTGQTGNGRASGTGCTDPNECLSDPCGAGTCSQITTGPGWAAPGYTCSCPAGYAFNGTTCVVQNECTAGVADCVAAASCSDPSTALGNFVCTCPTGQTGNGRVSGTGCTDPNECLSNPCGAGTCSQITTGPGWAAPGYTCSCPAGYAFNGTTCVVQNECTAGVADCVALASCSDPSTALGNFVCTCPAGYAGNGRLSGSGCTNIDECASNPCGGGTCSEIALGPSWSAPGYTCACNPGLGFDGTTCVVENECTAGTADCVAVALCADPTTAPGDFACTCPAGYAGNGRSSGTGCTNIDECAGNPCGAGTCSETPLGPSWSAPGYVCSCAPGYAFDGTTCALQDECVANLDDCVAVASCADPSIAPGNFVCTCPPGYSGNGRSSGTGCVNIDECSPSPCGVGTCSEIALGLGWSAPGYTCGCPAGYVFDGATCALQDECVANLDDCVGLASCTDPSVAPGDFVCMCPGGYVGNGRAGGTGCVDVDECALDLDDCSTLATCTNTPGSFTCACNAGFEGDGRTCTDVDECADPVLADQCSSNATCNNLFGDWECVCNSGYRGTGLVCEDIDECAEGSDDCSADGTCTNTIGSFTCACNAGYRGDGRVCDDVDECLESMFRDRCSSVATCNNRVGSWECVCNPGFAGDGFTCDDVDECADAALNECDPNASCTNTSGAYTCMCDAGYAGSGVTCADFDECAAGVGGCQVNEVCVNVLAAPNLCECAFGFSRPAPDQLCEVRCGDGVRGPGEPCDDGNVAAGDGCDAGCDLEPGWACYEPELGQPSVCNETCGDGLVDVGEECDDGAANSASAPDACRTTCRRASCGDGVVDAAEACDDGPANSDGAPDACRTTCERAYCGDGIIDTGERCDPGGGVAGASIAGQCTTLCAPDAGLDPNDPPSLTGGACRAGPGGAPLGAPVSMLLALVGLVLRRRR